MVQKSNLNSISSGNKSLLFVLHSLTYSSSIQTSSSCAVLRPMDQKVIAREITMDTF